MFLDVGLAEVAAAGEVAQEVGVAAADDGERGRQAEDLDELPVPGDQPQMAIEDRQALADIVECRLEQPCLLGELGFDAPALGEIAMEQEERPQPDEHRQGTAEHDQDPCLTFLPGVRCYVREKQAALFIVELADQLVQLVLSPDVLPPFKKHGDPVVAGLPEHLPKPFEIAAKGGKQLFDLIEPSLL